LEAEMSKGLRDDDGNEIPQAPGAEGTDVYGKE